MKLHRNAKLSVKGRELLIDRVEQAGWSLTQAAEAAGVSDRTARKWLTRYRSEGRMGLLDRSSAPVMVANRTDEQRIEVIAVLRRLRMTGARSLSARDGALDRVGDLDAARAGEAISSGAAGAPGAVSARAAWRADAHRRQETRTDVGRHGKAPAIARPPAEDPVNALEDRLAGSTCTSQSMTPPDWHMSRFSQTRKRRRRSVSCDALSSTTRARGIT